MEEKRIDELLNEELIISSEEIRKTEKTINHRMNQKILTKSFIVSMIVVLIAGCSIFGIQRYQDFIQEKNAFHLSDLEQVTENIFSYEFDKQQAEVMNAYAYANAYVTLFYPGWISRKDQVYLSKEPEKIHYGIYEIEATLIHLFDMSASGGRNHALSNQKIQIHGSNLYIHEMNLMETMFQNYKNKGNSLEEIRLDDNEVDEMKTEIEKLPETSIVMLDIMFDESMALDEVLKYQQYHEDSRVVYAVTHINSWDSQFDGTAEYELGPYGFNLFEGFTSVQVNDDYQEKYPSLTLSETFSYTDYETFWSELPSVTAKQLEEHYLSCMKLLVNNELAGQRHSDLQNVISDIEENGVQVMGVRIYATQTDALEWFENENTKSIALMDVKLSKYQK